MKISKVAQSIYIDGQCDGMNKYVCNNNGYITYVYAPNIKDARLKYNAGLSV